MMMMQKNSFSSSSLSASVLLGSSSLLTRSSFCSSSSSSSSATKVRSRRRRKRSSHCDRNPRQHGHRWQEVVLLAFLLLSVLLVTVVVVVSSSSSSSSPAHWRGCSQDAPVELLARATTRKQERRRRYDRGSCNHQHACFHHRHHHHHQEQTRTRTRKVFSSSSSSSCSSCSPPSVALRRSIEQRGTALSWSSSMSSLLSSSSSSSRTVLFSSSLLSFVSNNVVIANTNNGVVVNGNAIDSSDIDLGEIVIDEIEKYSIFDTLAHNPIFWSVLIMISIVGLLVLWERGIETIRENTPAVLQSVIDKVLGEIGGLGFIGLILSITLNKQIALGEIVSSVSGEFLYDDDILIESFEFLHEAFFQTGIIFFITTAFIIVNVLGTVNTITKLTEEKNQQVQMPLSNNGTTTNGNDSIQDDDGRGVVDITTKLATILNVQSLPGLSSSSLSSSSSSSSGGGDGSSSASTITTITNTTCMGDYEAMLYLEDLDKDENIFIKEATKTLEQRGAEILVIRERLIQEMNLPKTFRIRKYIENIFAQNKLDVVTISPLSWIPLIPAIAIANAIDIQHDVANAQAINAVASSGYFYSTVWVFIPACILQLISIIWGFTNFYKMAIVKDMLLPKLVRDVSACSGGDGDGTSSSTANAVIRLIPPAIENIEIRQSFISTPIWLKPIESIWKQPPNNKVEFIFGDIGAAGPALYLNSIKFHTWFCVTLITVYGAQIIPRDIYAITHSSSNMIIANMIGDPQHLSIELITYTLFTILNVLQLTLLSPTTSLNYCLVTCVEDMVVENTLNACCLLEDIEPYKK